MHQCQQQAGGASALVLPPGSTAVAAHTEPGMWLAMKECGFALARHCGTCHPPFPRLAFCHNSGVVVLPSASFPFLLRTPILRVMNWPGRREEVSPMLSLRKSKAAHSERCFRPVRLSALNSVPVTEALVFTCERKLRCHLKPWEVNTRSSRSCWKPPRSEEWWLACPASRKFWGATALSADFGEVGEQIVTTVVRLDETETFGVVEPLNSASCHFVQFLGVDLLLDRSPWVWNQDVENDGLTY